MNRCRKFWDHRQDPTSLLNTDFILGFDGTALAAMRSFGFPMTELHSRILPRTAAGGLASSAFSDGSAMKLTRRRVWVLLAVFVGVVALSLVFILVFDGDRITKANVDRIQKGMSLEQVWEILGPPTGTKTEWYSDATSFHGLVETIGATNYYWDGKYGMADVYFRDHCAVAREYQPKQIPWWSRFMSCFGL